MKQAVTQTSIASYRSLDPTKQKGRIAQHIVEESRANRPVYIGAIANKLKMDTGKVSARLNELKKGVFVWNGQHYRLEFAGTVLNQKTCRTVEAWRAVPAHDPGKQTNLF